MTISPEQLRAKLENMYPPNAQCWRLATDEVRDLCQYARTTLDLDDSHAVDFRVLKTPQAWNTIGIKGIVDFFTQMTDDQRAAYVENFQTLWGDGDPENNA